MNFHNFQAIIGSGKRNFVMKATTDSFAIATERTTPYIEPTFTKNEFDVEKPKVLLISAVGATERALAKVLSGSAQPAASQAWDGTNPSEIIRSQVS